MRTTRVRSSALKMCAHSRARVLVLARVLLLARVRASVCVCVFACPRACAFATRHSAASAASLARREAGHDACRRVQVETRA
eukprot:2793895-Pleurochrysis_carterae.AAC.1